MKNSRSFLLSFVLVALPCSAVVAGNVYKWTDEQGVVHYTDQKPNERAAETLSVRTAPSPASAPSSSESLDASVEDLKRQQEIQELGQRQLAEEEKEKQHKKQLCDSARQNLEVIQNNARIKVEENGEQRFLTPEEILKKRDDFQKAVQENC